MGFREGEGCRQLKPMQWVLRGHLQNAPGQREVNEMSSDLLSACGPWNLGEDRASQGGEMGHCTQGRVHRGPQQSGECLYSQETDHHGGKGRRKERWGVRVA